jgi:hypothetical protein
MVCQLHFRRLSSDQDDRFVAKQLSRQELQAMDTICPPYFSYMSSVVSTNVSAAVF